MRELISTPVPFQTFNDLSAFLDGRRSTEEFADVAGRAIAEWIAMQRISPTEEGAPLRGGYGSRSQLSRKPAMKQKKRPAVWRARILFSWRRIEETGE